MTKDNLKWLFEMKRKYMGRPDRILDVGSLDVNGEARSVFPECKNFTGIDMREGKGVDIVMRGDELLEHFSPNSFDAIICMNTLEHDSNYVATLEHMYTLLVPNGHLVIVTPTFMFGIHRHPKDYWRFGEDAYREVLFNPKRYELLDLTEQYTKIVDGKGVNPCLCAIGKKL